MLHNSPVKTLCFAYLLLISIFSCKDDQERFSNPDEFIPANSSVIIQLQDLAAFLSVTDSLKIINDNIFLFPENLHQHLIQLFQITNGGPSVLSFAKINNSPYNFTFISREQPQTLQIDSLQNKSLETIQFEDYSIQKYNIENFITYTTYKEGVFIASNSRDQMEMIVKSDKEIFEGKEEFERASAAADPSGTSIFLSHSYLDLFYKDAFPSGTFPLPDLAAWSVVEADINANTMVFNGVSIPGTSENNLLQVFSDAGNQPNELAKIAPTSSAGFYSITYSNFPSLHQALNTYRQSSLEFSENHLLNFMGEAGMIYTEAGNFFVLKATDAELAKELLVPVQNEAKEYRGVPIFTSENFPAYIEFLHPLFPAFENNYFTWLDNFLVISKTPQPLESIISNYLNKTTLWEQEYYNKAMQDLAGASSILMVGNSKNIKPLLKDAASKEFSEEVEQLNLDSYPILALQFVQERDFAHIHGVFSTSQNGNNKNNKVNQIATFDLGSTPGTSVFLLENPTSNQAEIAVQDEENVLHMFSSTGNLLWKKSFPSRITGEIRQVDLFRNGNLQMAFTTLNTLQVLDRNGNPVKPFPLEFRDEITQPLGVFDYDNNHNYRFVITQNNDLLMYDSKGRSVTGFDFKKANSEIIQPPKHMRFNNKDYIVFPEAGGKLNILSRQGKSRISVKGEIDFSENPWYANQNRFTSATSEGELLYVDEAGNIQKEAALPNLLVTANHSTLAKLSENILQINDKQITLDYGLYTAPAIHSANSKTYISITDTQAQKVYVFDKDLYLLDGFPVYGTSEAELISIEGAHFISVLGGEGEIILYQF